MNVLIIGHSSFIAQHLKKHHIAKDWSYISYIDYKTAPEWDKKPDCVINLALNPVVRQGEYSDLDIKIGQKAQEIGAYFIALSSRAVYGITDELTEFSEDSPFLDRCTPYGQAKRLIESNLLENLNNQKLIILRPSNIFGFECQKDKLRQSFFGKMLYDLKHSNFIIFNMLPEVQRDFLPVENFVNILVGILSKPKAGTFNVSSGIGTPCGCVANNILQGYESGALKIEPDAKNTDSFIINNQKLLNNYPLSITGTNKDVIQKACISIGRQLRQES